MNNKKNKKSLGSRILIALIIVIISSSFALSNVQIQDYEPSFYVYEQNSSRLLIEHFESFNSTKFNGGTPNENNYVAGKIVNAFDCDTSLINFGDNYDFTTQDFTLEIWINTTSSTSYANWGQHIVGKHEYGVWGAYALTYNKDSNTGSVTFKSGQASPPGFLWDVTSTVQVNDGEWHHIAVVRDYSDTSTGIKIYIDGVLDIEGTQTQGSCTTTQDFTVCSDAGGDETRFDGSVDELVISNYVKTADEIRADALKYPSNGTSFTKSIIPVNWSTAYDLDEDTITYDLLIDDNDDFSSPEIDISGLSNTNYTTVELNDSTYYWKVRPVADLVNGAYTKVKQFIITNLPPLINWILPNNNNNFVSIYTPLINITQNITFTDDYLNMYNCTIYNSTGHAVWSVQKTVLGNTSYEENSTINTAGWHGYYTENCSVSDI